MEKERGKRGRLSQGKEKNAREGSTKAKNEGGRLEGVGMRHEKRRVT